jgi:hypothetical protein
MKGGMYGNVKKNYDCSSGSVCILTMIASPSQAAEFVKGVLQPSRMVSKSSDRYHGDR